MSENEQMHWKEVMNLRVPSEKQDIVKKVRADQYAQYVQSKAIPALKRVIQNINKDKIHLELQDEVPSEEIKEAAQSMEHIAKQLRSMEQLLPKLLDAGTQVIQVVPADFTLLRPFSDKELELAQEKNIYSGAKVKITKETLLTAIERVEMDRVVRKANAVLEMKQGKEFTKIELKGMGLRDSDMQLLEENREDAYQTLYESVMKDFDKLQLVTKELERASDKTFEVVASGRENSIYRSLDRLFKEREKVEEIAMEHPMLG